MHPGTISILMEVYLPLSNLVSLPPIKARIPSTFSGAKKPRPVGNLPAEFEAEAMVISQHFYCIAEKKQKILLLSV